MLAVNVPASQVRLHHNPNRATCHTVRDFSALLVPLLLLLRFQPLQPTSGTINAQNLCSWLSKY